MDYEDLIKEFPSGPERRRQSAKWLSRELERRRFGDWVSGFTDGEGCFVLSVMPENLKHNEHDYPTASFAIGLRRDDRPVLEMIRSYWGCGTIHDIDRVDKNGKLRLSSRFVVAKMDDLAKIVISHFDSHPLWAKKRRDYEIWRTGVLLIAEQRRRLRNLPSSSWYQPKIKYSRKQWPKEAMVYFALLIKSLKARLVVGAGEIDIINPWLSPER